MSRPALAQATREGMVTQVLDWYRENARDLPWRHPGVSAWGVLVSEMMLQQTPVTRVQEVWQQWLQRWPCPADLAAEPSSAAVAAWGRLGYPRRALRLHELAVIITRDHAGVVPLEQAQLLALPGVGAYTAAAVASFAHGQPQVVLDTNVRRLLARVDGGRALPSGGAPSRAEQATARLWLDAAGPSRASAWAVGGMELAALICRARAPRCEQCPLRSSCRWLAMGRPPAAVQARRQSWQGTDRQCRGRLLEACRSSPAPLPLGVLLAHWPDEQQARGCLAALLAEGLLHSSADLVGL